MNLSVFVSTGAFIGRVNGRSHKPFLSSYRTMDADGYEFMMYESCYDKIDEIVSDFNEENLNIPVFHADKFIGQKIGAGDSESKKEALCRLRRNCEIANKLGADKMVLHLWNGPVSDDNIENNYKIFGELNEIAKAHGILLMPENVVCRHRNPSEHILELACRYPEARFTFDTKMAAFHNELDTSYEGDFLELWKSGRIAHLHINDYNGKYKDWDNLRTVHIGEGWIDFNRFFSFLSSISYEGTATLECGSMDENGIYPQKMNNSVLKIKETIEMFK